MALTELQRLVCGVLAEHRIAGGESHVAGGVAPNELLGGRRVSADIDLFHSTEEAVAEASSSDRASLVARGFDVEPVRELRGFVEVVVRDQTHGAVVVQWVRESAYRFFPLMTHPTLGLTLHPFDLATNEVLALVGRVEVRDWVDILTCHERLTPLGCLVWAATGKDAGLGPGFILEQAARTARYTHDEITSLSFDGPPPDAATLAQQWRDALADARALVDALPVEQLGCAVLDGDALFRGDIAALRDALDAGRLRFRTGSIGGALPTVRPL